MGISSLQTFQRPRTTKAVASDSTTATSYVKFLDVSGRGRIVGISQINNNYNSNLKITIDGTVVFEAQNSAVVLQYPNVVDTTFSTSHLFVDCNFNKSFSIEHRSLVGATVTTKVLYEIE